MASPLAARAQDGTTAPATDPVTTAGHAIVALIAKRDGAAIFARFTPEMARAIPQERLQGSLDQIITDQSPLGALVTESVRGQGGGIQTYNGEYHWRTDRNLTVAITFAPGGTDKIIGIRLIPGVEDKNAALRVGRSLAALIAAKDTKALEARFTPEMAEKIPEASLKQILESIITEKTPLGAHQAETVEDAGNGYLRYTGDYVWNTAAGQPLTIALTFESGGEGRVAGLILRPGTPTKLPPDPRADYKQKTTLHLPFSPRDTWYVFWGGNTLTQNYHVVAPDQRHALDLVAMKDGKTHDGDGKSLNQYYDWGRKIVAPAEGTVVEAVNDLPDNAPGVTDTAHPAGNHVLLDFGNGEYALLAHMQKGSVRVSAGQKVKQGDILGLCGNSGNTSEPHLHFHLQDKPALFGDALGLPVTFTDYLSNGKPVASGSPVKGETIQTK